MLGPQALQGTRASCVNPSLTLLGMIIVYVCRDSKTFHPCALIFVIGCASPDSAYYLKAELDSLPDVALLAKQYSITSLTLLVSVGFGSQLELDSKSPPLRVM